MSQRKPSNALALYAFLSSRLNQGRGFGSFVKGTAVLGILVGATALWITLSVVRGFSTVITDKTIEFAPELTISLASGERFTRSDTLVQRLETTISSQLEQSGRFVRAQQPEQTQPSLSVILDDQVMIQHNGIVTGGLLRGIEQTQFKPLRPFIEQDVCVETAWLYGSTDGESLQRSQRGIPVWMGQGLAQELGLTVGQSGRLLRLDMERLAQDLPTIGMFRLCGILATGIAPLDNGLVLAPLSHTQSFLDVDNRTGTGIAVNVDGSTQQQITLLQDAILAGLPYTFVVESVYQRWRSLFAWIELQEQTIPLVITFLVLIAAFNLVGAVMMMVLERTQAIAVLRVLGMPQSRLRIYFLMEGVRVALLGLFGAAVLTTLIHWIQWTTGVITLPIESYYMETMPLYPTVLDSVIVIGATLGLSILASWVPATIASKYNPTVTLRFQQ